MLQKEKEKSKKDKDTPKENINKNALFKKDQIPKGYAFAVINIVEKFGNKLIKLRSPLITVKWDGE